MLTIEHKPKNIKEIKDYMKGEDVILYKKDFHRLKINRK